MKPENINTLEQPWQQDAACKGLDPGIFYNNDGDIKHPDTELALAICGACAVRFACLDYALDNHEKEGVWGGTLPRERLRMLTKRRAQKV